MSETNSAEVGFFFERGMSEISCSQKLRSPKVYFLSKRCFTKINFLLEGILCKEGDLFKGCASKANFILELRFPKVCYLSERGIVETSAVCELRLRKACPLCELNTVCVDFSYLSVVKVNVFRDVSTMDVKSADTPGAATLMFCFRCSG